MVDPNASPFDEGHIICEAIFRSPACPEAMLNLRWRVPLDISLFVSSFSRIVCIVR